MKVINFESKADEKRYGVTSLINDVKRLHDDDGIEMLAVVYKKKNGVFGVGTTYGNNAEFVGLLEIGKNQLIDEMNE